VRIPAFLIRSRWTAALLLAVYGTAGLLGYGLHSLWDCDHCLQSSQASSGHTSCHHHCEQPEHYGGTSHSTGPENNEIAAAVDACPICVFLVQAQSPHYSAVEVEYTGTTTEVVPHLTSWYVAPLLGDHPARGPPCC